MAYCTNQKFVGLTPLFLALLLGSLGGNHHLLAADYGTAEQLFFGGKYTECAEMCRGEVDRGVWNEKWSALLMRCQLTTGEYDQAGETFEKAIERFKNSVGLRQLGREIYRYLDNQAKADEQILQVMIAVDKSPWRYSSSTDRVTLGRIAASLGEDARDVLKTFYDRARTSNPKLADVYVATAELALDKHDFQEAAKSIEVALELQPENPDIHLLYAKAWESDSEKTNAAVAKALELNPRHIPSLLLQVDHLIMAERYDDATELLTKVMEINHRHPEAWAYHAVIAHLQGNEDSERAFRKAALSSWSKNPHVDHLIGAKLSQKYRFKEGASYQRLALRSDPKMLEAKFQLAQDLLRLGIDDEGWRLADEVNQLDGYNVVAYNLVTLRAALDEFATVESDKFIIRMDARESRIYGQQVLELLTEAHDYMCEKYDVTLDGQTIVEIFPQQKDFAIRTFGLPGGAGFLGVCFGRVITANSPASQGERPSNWRSVLWHEFCHVVTLQKTRNKMPRWLSEGISVYEEQEKKTSWGERLTPQYRAMILGDELTPVSELSGAFLNPKSPSHLQFAYYESSLVVRYIVEKYGIDTIQRVLTDLGVGMQINESLSRYVGSISELDADFAKYAREYVKGISPDVDWERLPQLATSGIGDTKLFLDKHPNHYQALTRFAKLAIESEQYEDAEIALANLRTLYPTDPELDGVLALSALLYRKQEQTDKEVESLRALAALNDRALEVYDRLADLEGEQGNWSAVRENAYRFISVNPLVPRGHEMLAKSAEKLELHEDVAASLTATLEMNPVDPAGIHFRIANAHLRSGDLESAKRHTLMALEYAPRYRAAQLLLLQLVSESRTDT